MKTHPAHALGVSAATALLLVLTAMSATSAGQSPAPPPVPPRGAPPLAEPPHRRPPPDEAGPPGEPPPDVDELGRDVRGSASQPIARPRRAAELAALLFRPRPQDLGPLRPGEADTLMDFAKERMPRLYAALDWVRGRRPGMFQQRLDQMAPRIRQLKRVYERSPELGDALRGHMESMFEIRRRMQVLQDNEPGSALRERTIDELRDLVADSVSHETEALKLLADELDKRRDARIEGWMGYLLAAPAEDLARVPEELRAQVDAYHSARGDSERASARDRLREQVATFATSDVRALRERVEMRTANAADEVDRRLQSLIEDANRPGPPDGRPRPAPRPAGPRPERPRRP